MKACKSSVVVVCLLILMCSPVLLSQKRNDGWENGSKFNALFNAKNIDTLFGEIISVDSVLPMKGMTYGIQLVIKTGKETVTAILCPTWFTQCLNICLKPKDEIEVDGSRVIYEGKPIIIATRIICNGIILQMRNSQGHPIWDNMRQG
ncbi:MAG: hypothetical protein ACYCVH_07465 [Ignavibacteriaceae bacterium]